MASRPKASPPKQEPTTIEVRCGACGGLLAEAPCLAIEQRQPCPECGSLQRRVAVGIHEQLPLHDSLRARSRRPGKSGWLVDTEAGDDYTKLLEGWGSREVIYDREQDRYRELIKLHDGTRIESVARLSDHRQ